MSCEICSVMSDCLQPYGLHSPWHSPGQNTRILEWLAIPSPNGDQDKGKSVEHSDQKF